MWLIPRGEGDVGGSVRAKRAVVEAVRVVRMVSCRGAAGYDDNVSHNQDREVYDNVFGARSQGEKTTREGFASFICDETCERGSAARASAGEELESGGKAKEVDYETTKGSTTRKGATTFYP